MADAKISELSEQTTVAAADLFPVVYDPSGTPVTKKITFANLATAFVGAASNSFIFNEVVTGTINGSNTAFSLANTPIAGTLMLFLNGVYQNAGAGNDYTISGANITYLTAPLTGSTLLACYQMTVTVSGNADTLDGQHAPTGTIVGTTDTQTLTNKTLTSPAINNGVFTGGGALSSKLITANRDMTAASGDVAYTGVGFVPTSIHAIGAISGTNSHASGFTDSSKTSRNLVEFQSNAWAVSTNGLLEIATTGGVFQACVVKSYDADGFTLTWTKAGSPTGTANLAFICYR